MRLIPPWFPGAALIRETHIINERMRFMRNAPFERLKNLRVREIGSCYTADRLIHKVWSLQKAGLVQSSLANRSLDELEQNTLPNAEELENDIKIASWTLFAGAYASSLVEYYFQSVMRPIAGVETVLFASRWLHSLTIFIRPPRPSLLS